MLGVATDRGPDIEHDRFPAQRRPDRAERRPLDARQHPQVQPRHRHQRASVARRDRDIGLAALDRIDRKPHRRGLAAAAQRLARLLVHAHRDVGVDDPRHRLESRVSRELSIDHLTVAVQQEFRFRMPCQRDCRARNDDRGADIAPHGVQRNSNLLRHECPGNPILRPWAAS